MNVEASAFEMRADYLSQDWVQLGHGFRVLRCREILPHCFGVPQGRIDGVVLRLPACVGKIVG